jgi:hypothetical protein
VVTNPGYLDFRVSVRVGGGAGLVVGRDCQDPTAVGSANEIVDAPTRLSLDTMLLVSQLLGGGGWG